MRKLLIFMMMFQLVTSSARATFTDLTTGALANNVIGSVDPLWTVKSSTTGTFGSAYLVNPIPGVYASNTCGNWLSHGVQTTAQVTNGPATGQTGAIYTFKKSFNIGIDYCTDRAMLDLSFVAADAELRSIKINGRDVPIPTSPYLTENPGGSIYENITNFVFHGSNTNIIEVEVYSDGGEVAMMLCGIVDLQPIPTVNQTTTVVDISTAQNNTQPGNFDPVWTLAPQQVGGATILPLTYVANPVTETINGVSEVVYFMDPCAQWISPEVSFLGSPPSLQPTYQAQGLYVYQLEFELPSNCPIISATMDIPVIGSDNRIVSMTINGGSVSLPSANISFPSPHSMSDDVSSLVVPGQNTLQITVENFPLEHSGTPTALFVCGDITIEQACDECQAGVPVSATSWTVGTTFLPGGGVAGPYQNGIDWEPIHGALAYEVEVTYGDLACCGPGLNTYMSLLTSPGPGPLSEIQFTSVDECFAYRIRTVCCDGTFGEWSDYFCSGTATPPIVMRRSTDAQEMIEEAVFSAFPNPGSGLFQINTSYEGAIEYMVTDMAGRVVTPASKAFSSNFLLDLSEVPNGIYFLKIRQSEKSHVVKLMKQ